MKVKEFVKVLLKRKDLSKAERNFRYQYKITMIVLTLYSLFIVSNIIHAISDEIWWGLCVQTGFLILMVTFVLKYGRRYLREERKKIERRTSMTEEMYGSYPNMKELSLEAKATFVEYICSEQDDSFTQCVEALLEHYENTKHVQGTKQI